MSITAPLWLSALALASTSPEPSQPAENQAEAPKQAKADRKICRRVTDGMGSRRKVRLCMTKEEWRDFNRGE